MSGFLADRVLSIGGQPTAVALVGNRHYVPVWDGLIRCVVGEALNSVCLDVSLACTGAFMRRWLSEELCQTSYLRVLTRRNVCDFDREFSEPERAEIGACAIVSEMVRASLLCYGKTGQLPGISLILCGRRVWTAFLNDHGGLGASRVRSIDPDSFDLPPSSRIDVTMTNLPHPSGRNREWNDPVFSAEWRGRFASLALCGGRKGRDA